MAVTFPEITVGDPIRHDGLSVFPLFGEPSSGRLAIVPSSPAQADHLVVGGPVGEGIAGRMVDHEAATADHSRTDICAPRPHASEIPAPP